MSDPLTNAATIVKGVGTVITEVEDVVTGIIKFAKGHDLVEGPLKGGSAVPKGVTGDQLVNANTKSLTAWTSWGKVVIDKVTYTVTWTSGQVETEAGTIVGHYIADAELAVAIESMDFFASVDISGGFTNQANTGTNEDPHYQLLGDIDVKYYYPNLFGGHLANELHIQVKINGDGSGSIGKV